MTARSRLLLICAVLAHACTIDDDARIPSAPEPTNESAYSSWTSSCPPEWMLTTPIASQCCTKNFQDEGGRPVTKLSKTGWVASASSQYQSTPPSQAIDGSTTTRWWNGVGMAADQWFEVDTGSCKTISRVVMSSGTDTPNDFPRGYEVWMSNDNQYWRRATSGTGTSATVDTGRFTPVSGRYWRISLTGSSSAWWWSISDLQLFGYDCDLLPRTGWTAIGYASNGSVLSGVDPWGGNISAGQAVDSDPGSRFSTGAAMTPGQALVVDMKSCFVVSRVAQDSTTDTEDFARHFDTYVSNDNVNWTFADTDYDGRDWSPIESSWLHEQRGRYLKVVQTGTHGWAWWSIHDLRVYGFPCSEATQEQPISTVFTRTDTNAVIMRHRNPSGQACVGYAGEACSGAECYYGPNGFSRPISYPAPSSSSYPKIESNLCDVNYFSTTQTPYWSAVTGTYPTGGGCPGGTNGAGQWDY